MFRRMRRILNVPLVAATALTVAFTLMLVAKFGTAREDLRIAKDDAFASIHLLWQARATAYDANGDESRYLLDADNRRAHQSAFDRRVAILTSRPADRGNGTKSPTFTGLFADELMNVTFPGELEAARDMVSGFAGYYAIDRRIRSLEAGSSHDAAVELAIGNRADESNAAFAKFDEALERVLHINKQYFDERIEEGTAGLRTAVWLDPIFAIAIAALGFFGIRPRLREYTG
jgi:hypothetical protein